MSSLKEVLENTERLKQKNGTFFRRHDKVDQLKAENAKLREVVDIFIHCIGDLHSCYTCQVKGNPYDFQHDWGACDELRDMLVDMGFEVPDAENA